MPATQNTLFPACFSVSRQLLSGANLAVHWLVNTTDKTIAGSGRITQAVNPLNDIALEMRGHYDETDDGEIRFVAGGTRPGAAIQMSMMLKAWDGSGTADVKWLANRTYFSDDGVPVKPITCFK